MRIRIYKRPGIALVLSGALFAVAAPAFGVGCGPSSSAQGPAPASNSSFDAAPNGAGRPNPAPSEDASNSEGDASPRFVGDAGSASDAGSTFAGTGDASASDGEGMGEAGVPYKGVANSPCADLASLRAAWYYNWTLSAGSCATPQFVPMIWGHTGDEQTAAGIAKEIATIAGGGYGAVLGFNEPDNSSQSNITVETAISLWPSFAGNASLRIGSPATQANSSGQAWFTKFMQQIDADTTGKLRVDFIAAHWYGWNAGSCDKAAASLESYLRWLEGLPGKRPIWLTEWGCLNQSNPTAEVVQAFFSGAVAMFAKHPRLERYAWYPWTTNNELVKMGALTPLGNAFAALPPYK